MMARAVVRTTSTFGSFDSKQFSEFLNGQSGIARDSTHGERFNGIVPRGRDLPIAIVADSLRALRCNPIIGPYRSSPAAADA